MKNLKSKIAVVVSLLMLTLVVTANVTPAKQDTGIQALSLGHYYDTNY